MTRSLNADLRAMPQQQRADVLRRRIAWFDGPCDLDPDRLIFIDETAASTKMARLRRRCLPGERCPAAVAHGHRKTTTFTAGLRLNGMAAPMLLDGSMSGPAFLAYAEQVLAPELCPGDVVDSLPARKSAVCARRSRRLVRGSCCRALRPTSNPIEMAFSKLKTLLRRAAAELSTNSGQYWPTSRQSTGTISRQKAMTPE